MRCLSTFCVATLLIGFGIHGQQEPSRRQLEPSFHRHEIAANEVTTLRFRDEQTGWMAVCSEQRCQVMGTKNGGKSWTARTVPNRPVAVYFQNALVGWCLTLDTRRDSKIAGYLLGSEDGGGTWKVISSVGKMEPRERLVLHDMLFVNEREGWFLADGYWGRSVLMRTMDSGKTLERVPLPQEGASVARVLVSDRDSNLWALGRNSIMRKPAHGKGDWEILLDAIPDNALAHEFDIAAGWFFTSGKGLVAGQGMLGVATILATDDSGKTWSTVYVSESMGNISAMHFVDDSVGHATLIPSGLLLETRDGGMAWSVKSLLPPAKNQQDTSFSALQIFESGRGWLLRNGGFLYQTCDGGLTWLETDPFSKLARVCP